MSLFDVLKALFGLLLVGAGFLVGTQISNWAFGLVKEAVKGAEL